MAPSDYVRSRLLSANGTENHVHVIDNRPYLPNLNVDINSENSIKYVAFCVVINSMYIERQSKYDVAGGGDGDIAPVRGRNIAPLDDLKCTRISGGITNALYRVDGLKIAMTHRQGGDDDGAVAVDAPPSSIDVIDCDSVLVRIFGAEGMIDRDVETSTYSALCDAGIAHRHIGRFGNGRVEGWLVDYVPLSPDDLSNVDISMGIAREMANMHANFVLPPGELRDVHYGTDESDVKVGLWDQLLDWLDKARGYDEFKTPEDTNRVKELKLDEIDVEVRKYVDNLGRDGGKIVFSHNDLLAANIMRHVGTGEIRLIDFEYGGTNYAAFDIANHLNEHAGGTTSHENGIPDYTKFPNIERQFAFCLEYVRTTRAMTSGGDVDGDDANDDAQAEARDLLERVQKFLLVNHLYWGLWAVNQAAVEGCDEFDYLNFATSRIGEFRRRKREEEDVASE